jgi:SAM-dependent methyltransferase
LILPGSEGAADEFPPRLSRLTIDGEDYSEPRSTRRTILVPVAPDQTEAMIVFSFWPVLYTNIVRTQVVNLIAGAPVAADLTQEDATTPDVITTIFVPTSPAVAEQMCRLAEIGPGDVVYDVGCGDGRLVIMAVKEFGARKGIGIEIEPCLLEECRANAKQVGVANRVEFWLQDALEIKDFSEATVVLLYLGEILNERLKAILRASLKPGARVVSHGAPMGDDWPAELSTPVLTADPESGEADHQLHRWRIE